MGQHFVRNGVFCGVTQITFTLVLYLLDPILMLSWSRLFGFVIMIYFMRKSTMATKFDQLGFISLSEAFKTSWLTYVLGSFIMAVFTFFLMNYIDPSLILTFKALMTESFEKLTEFLPMPEDKLREQMEQVEANNPFGITSLAFDLPFSFIFPGAFIAFIMSLFLKKEQPISS